jgi:gliding motility-associated-like protein
MQDIAITPNGSLYCTDGKKIHRINITNCINQQITDTVPSNGQWINSLVALDDEFLFAASSSAELYKISTITGLSYVVDTIKQDIDSLTYWYPSGGDLTWYKNKLYYATANNDLVKITLDINYNQIQNVEFIGNMDTPFNSVYGALTIGDVNCTSDNLRILAFEGQDIYQVDPSNANLQMLCDSIFPCSNFGATSLTEVSNQDYTNELELPNIFTPNNDNVNDFFKPVKNKNIESIEIFIYDRWGLLTFNSNDTNFAWNGINKNGKESSDGVYFFILKAVTTCDEKIEQKGFITLLK